jgi:hypothetical protein
MANIPTIINTNTTPVVIQPFPLSPSPITQTSMQKVLSGENITTEEDHLNLDKLFTKINYNNEMIKLYEIDKLNSQNINQKELIDRKINNLIQDRNSLLNYLNQLYDSNTNQLNLTYKVNTNDKYIKDIQSKEIKINNQKINELNNEKMNKDRKYEIALYQIEEKKAKNNYLFWGLISITLIIIIYLLKYFNLFNNFSTIVFTSMIFVSYLIYITIQLALNNNRNKRYYDKYNFPHPPPTPQEEENCQEEINIKIKQEEECLIKNEEECLTKNEEEESKKNKTDTCLNSPTLSESQLEQINNPLLKKLDL